MSATAARIAALFIAAAPAPMSIQLACGGEGGHAHDGLARPPDDQDTAAPRDALEGDLSSDTAPAVPDSEAALDVAVDAASDTPATRPPDAVTEPAPLRLGHHYLLETNTGPVAGELIATYDHRHWWKAPTDEETLALFSADRFAPWPDDRSILFVERSRVLRYVESPPPEQPFRVWRHARGLGFKVPLEGPAFVMAGHERHHLEENGYGDFAYDLGVAEDGGRRWHDDGLDLTDYFSWDVEATSPTSGFVVEVERHHPDRPIGGEPPDLDAPENLVGLWLEGSYHAYVLHHRQDSLPAGLEPGDWVDVGEPLGRIGNSGTSLEPHLHLALLYWDHERARFWSVPVDFLEVHAAPRPTGSEPRALFSPLGGAWVGNAPF